MILKVFSKLNDSMISFYLYHHIFIFLFFCAIHFLTLKKMQFGLECSNSPFIPFLSAPKTDSCWFGLPKVIFQRLLFFSSLNIYQWLADFSRLRSPTVIEILTILLYQLGIKHCYALIFFWSKNSPMTSSISVSFHMKFYQIQQTLLCFNWEK